MMTTEEMVMYDQLVDMGIATAEEINLAYNVAGGNWIGVLNKILYVRTGYRSIEQMLEKEEDFLFDDTAQAHKMASKTLEQKPCEDTISRQIVLDMLDDINAETEGVSFYFEHWQNYIKNLPPAPSPRH